MLRDIDDALEFKWDTRDAVTVYPKGAGRFWCRIKTKESDALEVWFTQRAGTATVATYENFGRTVKVEGDRADGSEVLKLWLTRPNHLETAELKPLLAEHLKAFRKGFKV
jgi:excinuclease ABC subunit A